jgi:putrescine transport system permease protein
MSARDPRRLVRAAPLAWLAVFALLPFLLVVKMSLSNQATAQPPYRPAFRWEEGIAGWLSKLGQFSFDNFATVFSDDLLWGAYLNSLRLATLATLLTLLIALLLVLPMARAPRRWQPILVMLVVLPFLTSFLIRAYAWIGILKPEGLLNQLLLSLGLIAEPLVILNTDTAVVIGIVYSYLPFMVLPLYASLEKFDGTLIEAAADLGARPAAAFFLVVVPNLWPAILAGSALVFIPAMGEFVIPDLLGGSDTLMVGRVIWNEFFANRDWPLAAAMSLVLLAVLLVPILVMQRRGASA